MSDDLTIAYQLGVEDMRSKLHKQADEIERLRAENEKLQEKEKDYLEMLRRQAQTIVKLWKMMGSLDKMESGNN